MLDFYEGQAARDLVDCDDHYVKVGARTLVSDGRGDWTLDTPKDWRFSYGAQLWRAPDGVHSVGTLSTGELYGEDE